jgi:hypothetical protein
LSGKDFGIDLAQIQIFWMKKSSRRPVHGPGVLSYDHRTDCQPELPCCLLALTLLNDRPKNVNILGNLNVNGTTTIIDTVVNNTTFN